GSPRWPRTRSSRCGSSASITSGSGSPWPPSPEPLLARSWIRLLQHLSPGWPTALKTAAAPDGPTLGMMPLLAWLPGLVAGVTCSDDRLATADLRPVATESPVVVLDKVDKRFSYRGRLIERRASERRRRYLSSHA